ncbi:MAG TPA: DHH family phosphoesterase [Methanocella sp.]|nr:DHH family phosphoesterase [Methanocella sp.]
MLDAASQLAKPAADKLFRVPFVRVISHHDADGITACGIVCHTLLRKNIPFQATNISNLDATVEEILDPGVPVIFCDMGSGQPDIVNKYDAIILDHHVPLGTHKNIQVNPHLIGVDGGSEMSASGVAYALARVMGDNVDLAGLAISGAIGDKQKISGPNMEILDEAVKGGIITVQKGMKLGKGPLEKVLEHSIDPYFDFSGKHRETDRFIEDMGLTGNIESLSPEDQKRLGSALSLLLLKKSPPESIDALFGDVYLLNRELIQDIYDFTNTVNSCGKMGMPGLGLELCLRHSAALKDAEEKRFEYSRQILDALNEAITQVKDIGWVRCIDFQSSDVTGAVASTVIRYILPDKPLVVLNMDGDKVKVSARGTSSLIKQGLDLSMALREGAALVGGSGGGHRIASGAAIPAGSQRDFLEYVNTIIGRQIGGKV